MTCEELEEQMGFAKLNIRKGMAKLLSGVSERRIAELEVNASDLAAEAGKMALEQANLKPEDVDMLIFAAVSQDLVEPATANIVMDKLDIRNAKGIDVKNACNAFISSIEIANMYIKCGNVKNVLIVSGEKLSVFVKMKFTDMEEIKNVNSTFSVGDAGGAIVLQSYESEKDDNNIQTSFKTFPDTWADGALLGGGTMYPHDPEKFYAQNESRAMLKVNFNRAVEFYNESIDMMNVDYDKVSLFIPPQITKYIVTKMTEALKLPEDRVVSHVNNLGNISTASFPVALSMAVRDGRLKLGCGQKVICFGAANGFSAGIAYMTV